MIIEDTPTSYTEQKSPEQLIGNILAIAESGHGHLRVLVSEASVAIQSLKDENERLRDALESILDFSGDQSRVIYTAESALKAR